MCKILVIDDEVVIGNYLSFILKKNGYQTKVSRSGKHALELFKSEQIDLVFCDFQLSDMKGSEVLQKIKKVNPNVPVIIFTGYADVKTAVHVMKLGAFDYLIKPLVPDEVQMVVKKAINKRNNSPDINPKKNQTPKKKKTSSNNTVNISVDPNYDQNYIIGKSKESLDVQKQMKLVAKTNYSVIIYGESGTGKESIAKGIHQLSKRKEHPFIAVDCGALVKDLSGSELFGHEKGAFTGAYVTKPGQFELADKGTIFLDEIGNLSYDIQTSLLRAIQERKIRRLGSQKETPINVRIIVASNKHLEELVKKGKFREDLYHRLNEFSIHLPSLRDRNEDLSLFAAHFLKLVNQELDKHITGISEEAFKVLLEHRWPGNLRELNNVIRRAALLTEESMITPESLPPDLIGHSKIIFEGGKNTSTKTEIITLDEHEDLKSTADRIEEFKIRQTLRVTNNNKSKAARLLGIDRKTLYNKLHEYDIKK